ncbi:MAG: UMP kinase [Puniceicoccales bacterium]|nr:UMP kinase [Puniceicoccales bacterium]
MSVKYKRCILKFSGEILKDGDVGDAISFRVIGALCEEIKSLNDAGFELGIVIGGGNIFRGAAAHRSLGCDRVAGDYIGMLATTINSMAIGDCLEKLGVGAVVLSSLPMPDFCEPYYPRRAQKAIGEGTVLLLAGGTGRAFFSTDSAAALRASELCADVVVKATKVDGVYDKDPKKYGDAKKFDRISFQEILARRLSVMDSTAFSLCMDNDIPVIIVDAERDLKNIGRVLRGESLGTTIANY